jgi:serine protease
VGPVTSTPPGAAEPPGRPTSASYLPRTPVSSRATDSWTRLLIALAALVVVAVVSPGRAAAHVFGQHEPYQREVIVRYDAGTARSVQARIESTAGTRAAGRLPGGSRRLEIRHGEMVRQAVATLRRDPRVVYAVPNYAARATAFYPNDPGLSLQWNFTGPFGINMPEAWSLASSRNAPGGRGAIVAVLDTGVAYRQLGPRRRAPDLRSFVRGYDFVDDDAYPLDANGHGTHVAGTIAEATNNRIGASGIAYGARIMPVRTLDASGAGDAITISRGIRYAVSHHANVINLSLEFSPHVDARDIPDVLAALRYARRQGVVVTTVAGNEANPAALPFPARSGGVIAVAATTANGCQAKYSNAGAQVDVAAPGGGPDAAPADDDWDRAHCHPEAAGRSIYQETLGPNPTGFALPSGYYGTSMAAPHVAGLAALIIASQRLGPHPSPAAVQQLIEQTARDVGPPGYDIRYGHGLIDAAAALR